MIKYVSVLLALGVLNLPAPANAWGAMGHRLINGEAIRALPPGVPAFVRSTAAQMEVAALGPEADRLKGAGQSWDADYDPGHYLDLSDDGTVGGVVPLANLPPTREAYDTALRSADGGGRAARDQYQLGYLPYSILEGWQQIVMDFALWRVDAAGEAKATGVERDAFEADRQLREVLTLRDIGYWGHFVADGSQPLHVSVHFNGWGAYANPNGYTQSKTIHAQFETAFVNANANSSLVAARIPAYAPSSVAYPAHVAMYLQATAAGVPAVYRFAGTGALATNAPDAVAFMLDRLAAGATMLRDSIADAWAASADARIGYPGVRVRDIENGTIAAPIPAATN